MAIIIGTTLKIITDRLKLPVIPIIIYTNSMSTAPFVWLNQQLSYNLAGKEAYALSVYRYYPISIVDLQSPVILRS